MSHSSDCSPPAYRGRSMCLAAPAEAGQGVGTLSALDHSHVVRLSVGLSSALIEQIKAIAALEQRSQGAVARMLIAEALRIREDRGSQA